MFLKEETFCDYLQAAFPEQRFEKGHSVISINVVQLQPIMSCVYITDDCIAAAKYNRQFQIFSDGLCFEKNQIQAIVFRRKGLGGVLHVQTSAKVPNGQPVSLQLTVSPLTGTNWHKKNFQNISTLYQEHS